MGEAWQTEFKVPSEARLVTIGSTSALGVAAAEAQLLKQCGDTHEALLVECGRDKERRFLVWPK